MLSVDDITCIHDTMIDTYGGIRGVRDKGLLSSIVSGVNQTYGGCCFISYSARQDM